MGCQWNCWWSKVLSKCPQSHFAVVVSFHFSRFDLTADCPGARLSIVVRTAQSHMKRSATPRCGRAAFGLAKKFSAWLLRDLICHAIFSSCALMHFWCVIWLTCVVNPVEKHHLSSSSLSVSAPATASLPASYCFMEGVARVPVDFYKQSLRRRFRSQLELNKNFLNDVVVLDLMLGRLEVGAPKPSKSLFTSSILMVMITYQRKGFTEANNFSEYLPPN